MKKKILFALAMPALLAACTNEEIAEIQSSEMSEVVGAELVSNGMTINFGENAQSRMTAAGTFDDSDKLGLGWVTTEGPSTVQNKDVQPNLNKLYANHLFVKDGEADGAFTTYSNVYTGWHFAYYPYTRMPAVGQLKIDNINPKMANEYTYADGTKAEYLENRFHISAKDFINPSDVDENNALVGKTFNLLPMVSTFTVAAEVANDVLAEEDLKTLKITKLELIADKDMFYSKAELNPQHLPSAVYTDVDPTSKVKLEYDAAKTKNAMTVANLFGADKAIAKTGLANSIATEIAVESYKLDGLKTMRMNILPIDAEKLYATATPGAVSLKVYVEGGVFTVAYTPVKKDAHGNTIAYTATEATNNTAIAKVANLLSVAGHKKTQGTSEVYVNWSNLIANEAVKVSLSKENFDANYNDIMNIGQWNGCVKVANALNEKPTFKLGNGAKIEFPAGEMNVPNKGVVVTREAWGDSQLIFKGATTWNAKISGCDAGTTIVVEEGAELTVENPLWASRIVNKGTIFAGASACIGDSTSDRFDNENGRVVVKYGAYIYPSTNKEGIIAYNVDGTESAAKINTLVATTGSQNGYAKVNTLIIANNVALDLTKKDGDDVDNDRYHGSTQFGNELADMTNVAIEMNGGTIKAALNKVKNVHNVTIKGGQNTIKDIDVMGALQVEAGSVTIDATEYTIEKIVAGNKVYENVKNAADVNYIEVEKGATFNVTVDTYTSDIVNDGAINVIDPYVLRYANTIEQSGSQSGKIVKGSIDLSSAIAAGGEVNLYEDVADVLNLSDEKATINLNGNAITGSILTNADLTVKNGEIVNENFGMSAIEINSGKLTLEDVVISSARHAVRIDGQVDAEIKSGEYKAKGTAGKTGHALNVSGNAKVIIYGGTFVGPKGTLADSGSAVNVQAGSEVVIEGGDFSGGKNKTLQVAATGKLTVKGGTFDQDPSAYVDLSKYEVTEASGIYTVTEK